MQKIYSLSLTRSHSKPVRHLFRVFFSLWGRKINILPSLECSVCVCMCGTETQLKANVRNNNNQISSPHEEGFSACRRQGSETFDESEICLDVSSFPSSLKCSLQLHSVLAYQSHFSQHPPSPPENYDIHFFLFLLAIVCHFRGAATSPTPCLGANNLCHFIEWLMFSFVLFSLFSLSHCCRVCRLSWGEGVKINHNYRSVKGNKKCFATNVWLSLMRVTVSE